MYEDSESTEMAALQIKSDTSRSSTPSLGSMEKDDLLDEIQNKIGEFLKTNQELYSTRNQAEYLKESIENQKSSFENDKNQYENKISLLTNELVELKATLLEKNKLFENLNKEKQSLEQMVNDMKEKSDKELLTVKKECEERILKMKDKYRQMIKEKNIILQSNESCIIDLNKENHLKDTISTKQQYENEKLSSSNDSLHKENQSQREEIAELKRKIGSCKSDSIQSKKELSRLKKELDNQILQTKDIQDKYSKQGTTMKEIEKENNTMKKNIAIIMELFPDSNNEQDVINTLKLYLSKIQNLKMRLKQKTKAYIELSKEKEVFEEIHKETINELNQIQAENDELKRKILANESEIMRSNECINALKVKNKIANQIRQTNEPVIDMGKQLSSILTQPTEKLILKPIIDTVIMLRRWKSIVHTEKLFVKDQQNWWWMGRTSYYSVPSVIISEAEKLQKDKKNLSLETSDLRVKVLSLENDLKEIREHRMDSMKDHDRVLCELGLIKEKLEFSEKEKSELLEMNPKQLKDQLSQYEQQLLDLQEKIIYEQKQALFFKDQCNQMRETVTQERAKHNHIQKLLAETQKSLSQAISSKKAFQQGFEGQVKNVLALERAIASEERKTSNLITNNENLLIENQILAKKINGKDNIPSNSEEKPKLSQTSIKKMKN